jgi:hypothetical protein
MKRRRISGATMAGKASYVCRACFHAQSEKMARCPVCQNPFIAYVRSKSELKRWGQLRMLERAGEISELQTQPVYPLTVNGVSIGRYTADFRYRDKGGDLVVEDHKGADTDASRLRRKLAEAEHGIKILLT